MDTRIEHIFYEETKNDKSFCEKDHFLSALFGGTKFTKSDMRDTWKKGIKHGIEIGLRKASLDGQKIELNSNTINPKQKEFLEKFYELAKQYKCAVQYHPEFGMVVVDRDPIF